ncbi:MAG: CHAT domain-containing tetratricopeptide repeat protein [Cyanobacteria bacterium P01_A01_bin.84]
MMHYRFKYFTITITTAFLSLIFPTGLVLSETVITGVEKKSISRKSSTATITAQALTKKQLRDKALRLYKLGVEQKRTTTHYRKALNKFREALAIFRQIGDKLNEGATLNKIGDIYYMRDDFAKALDSHQQALITFKQIDAKFEIAETLDYIGKNYGVMGEDSKALSFYKEALTIYKHINNRRGEGFLLKNIGRYVYCYKKDYHKAVDYLKQALTIFEQLNDKEAQGWVIHDIGDVYSEDGKYFKALIWYRKALSIFKNIPNFKGEGWTLNDIGFVLSKQKKYLEALYSHIKALNIFQKIEDETGKGVTLRFIGDTYLNQQNYLEALNSHYQALAVFKQTNNLGQQVLIFNNIAEIYNIINQYHRAEKSLYDAINIWEYLQADLSDSQKVFMFEKNTSTYSLMQKVLVSQNKTNIALEISERARARALVELLASKVSEDSKNKISIKPPSEKELKLIAVQQNATLVEYSVIDDSLLYIWVVKPTGEIAFEKVDIKTLNKPLKNFVANSRNSIGARGRGMFTIALNSSSQTNQKQNLHKLHQLLIEPIARHLPKNSNERIVFIPHDSLFLVPFPALIDENGDYLIEKHTILTAPAIQVLGLTHKQKRRLGRLDFTSLKSQDSLVVGNPVMPRVGIPPKQLYQLPGAEKEARKIAKILNTKALTGKQATKETILKRIPTAKIIHLATHGLLDDFDERVPGALALTPNSKVIGSKTNEGLLTATEIINLNINADLVVLSACDTGRGKITSDGVIGLSRALITAGTPSVIVSLWSVPDAPTAELMTEFYRQLKLTGDKAQSLRHAMLKLKEKYPDTPRKWAAFTLIGEAE